MQEVDVLVISISDPLLIGIYYDKRLIHSYKQTGKTSDLLPQFFSDILNQYTIKDLYYVNGPGSYMSIKVSYIFLKTLAITKNLSLYAISGFELNHNSPIKAIGKKYFVQKNGTIELDFICENDCIKEFALPIDLNDLKRNSDNLPNYVLPAV